MTPPPDTYYEMLNERLPWHGEEVEDLKNRAILMDGAPTSDGGLLLQIFTETAIGPIFLRLFSARATKALERVTSRLCSKAWRGIRFVEVFCRKNDVSCISQIRLSLFLDSLQSVKMAMEVAFSQ